MQRLKTEKEFKNKFGVAWRNKVEFSWKREMDFLYSRKLSNSEYEKLINTGRVDINGWAISRDMLAEENKELYPIF